MNILKNKKIRFILVGMSNTAIDFGLFMALLAIGLPTIASNYVSTTLALAFSFLVNRRFTFNSQDHRKVKQLLLFLSVTLFGLWAIQPVIISNLTPTTLNISHNMTAAALLAKMVATVVTLIWNYYLYDRLVFKRPKTEETV